MRPGLLFLATLVAATGCSRLETGSYKDERHEVKGTVLLDGKPLTNATITFVGTAGQRPAGGPVIDGKFHVSKDQGPNAGKYKVEVRWQKPTGKKVKDSDTGQMIDVIEEGLPGRYHYASILTATIGEKDEFEFLLLTQ